MKSRGINNRSHNSRGPASVLFSLNQVIDRNASCPNYSEGSRQFLKYLFVRQESANRQQHAEMIRIVIGNQQGFAQNSLAAAVGNLRKQIN